MRKLHGFEQEAREGSGRLRPLPGAAFAVLTNEGTQCLIHANGQGLTVGQDRPSLTGTLPVTIAGGDNNPNPALQGQTNISRSDSIVTVPIYQGVGPGNANLCPGGVCTGTGTIMGFVQLGITQNAAGGNGKIEGVILNVAGCNPGAGGTPVLGGGVSPIPVRLIHQ